MLAKYIDSGFVDRTLLVMHSGFGCDLRFWKKITDSLRTDFDILILAENYFKSTDYVVSVEDVLEIMKNRDVIVGGHSLGYAKMVQFCEKYGDKFKLKKIFAIAGFSNFLSDNPIAHGIRKLSLDMMIFLYKVNLVQTFVMFLYFCGEMFPTIPSDVDKDLFFKDLLWLNDRVVSPTVPDLVLSSLDDPTIPWYVIEDNFRKLKDVSIKYTFGAMHLLGDKNSEYVAGELKKFTLS